MGMDAVTRGKENENTTQTTANITLTTVVNKNTGMVPKLPDYHAQRARLLVQQNNNGGTPTFTGTSKRHEETTK